jgi:zinc transporter 9
MAGDDSKGAVLAALGVNSTLTVLKFTAFAFSGSGSMFAEGMHTLADTANQALLFIGIKRSEKEPNALFTYGYGGERFLFALLSAVGIFVLGCGVTVYHGIHSLMHPYVPNAGWMDYAILGIGFLLDGWVLWKAYGAINKKRGDQPFFKFLKTSDDPTIAAVLLEDSVACLGVVVALIGILISAVTRNSTFDAIGSIIIGALLGFIAVWLGYKNRSLILGRAIPDYLQDEVIEYLNAQDSVEKVRGIQSRIIGAENYKLKAEIDWNGRWLGEKQLEWVKDNKGNLDSDEGMKDFASAFGERMTEAIAEEIDRIEIELQKKHPELTFLDFEGDASSGHTSMIPKPAE